MKESPRDGGWAQPMVSSSYLVPLRSGGLGVPSQEDGPGVKLAWQVTPIHLAFCGQTKPQFHDNDTIMCQNEEQ